MFFVSKGSQQADHEGEWLLRIRDYWRGAALAIRAIQVRAARFRHQIEDGPTGLIPFYSQLKFGARHWMRTCGINSLLANLKECR